MTDSYLPALVITLILWIYREVSFILERSRRDRYTLLPPIELEDGIGRISRVSSVHTDPWIPGTNQPSPETETPEEDGNLVLNQRVAMLEQAKQSRLMAESEALFSEIIGGGQNATA